MAGETAPITEAAYIDAPRDPRTKALYDYWSGLRHGRAMPSRADIDPIQIPALLPYIIMYDVGASGGYTVRLVGEEVVHFVGQNLAGQPAGSAMPPRSAEMMVKILDAVTSERAPRQDALAARQDLWRLRSVLPAAIRRWRNGQYRARRDQLPALDQVPLSRCRRPGGCPAALDQAAARIATLLISLPTKGS